jgi:hypothetical protein
MPGQPSCKRLVVPLRYAHRRHDEHARQRLTLWAKEVARDLEAVCRRDGHLFDDHEGLLVPGDKLLTATDAARLQVEVIARVFYSVAPMYKRMMADEKPPYWALIAALFSSISLTETLAMALYHAGCDLYQRNQEVGEIAGDLISGKLRRLREHVVLGTFSGPAYEARIDTERGPAVVRFLITREGLQWLERQPPPHMRN